MLSPECFGNNTECFGNKCCKKSKNLDKPRNIKHGNKRFFSYDYYTNNCPECCTAEQILELNSNADEITNFCFSCKKRVQRMKFRFKKNGEQICVECAKDENSENLFSPMDIQNSDPNFSGFIESFRTTFEFQCGIIGDNGNKILSIYDISFKICYVSNTDKYAEFGEEETDENENKKGFIRFIMLVFTRLKKDSTGNKPGEWSIFLSMKLEYFDSSFESSTRICNQNTCYLALLDTVRFDDKVMDKDTRKLFIFILLSTSVQWGRDNLGTEVYSFWACAPKYKGQSYMIYCAEISRINGHKDLTGTPESQNILLKFYDEFIDFLKKANLVVKRTTLADYCDSNEINEKGDLFLFIYAGDYASNYFNRVDRRFFNTNMDAERVKNLKKNSGFTKQSYVLELTSGPDLTSSNYVSDYFPISENTNWGIDQNTLIKFTRRNHLGFANYDLQVQTTQLLIRYILNKEQFYILHCAHCWAFLTSDTDQECLECKGFENWPKSRPALLCKHCALISIESSSHKGIRERLQEDNLT